MLVIVEIKRFFFLEYAGHCRDIASKFDYTHWDAVIICSGDGLAHEVCIGRVFVLHGLSY